MTRVLCLSASLLCLWGAGPRVARAQRLGEIFDRGNHQFFEGNFEAATQSYGLLVDAGVSDPDVCFNMATAFGRLGRYGESIRWFERALARRPGDADAEAGLAQARSALGHRQAEATGEAMVETRPAFGESLARPFSEDTLGWAVLALDVLLFALLLAFSRVRAEGGRLALGIAAPLVGVLLMGSGAGLAIKAGVFQEGRGAIVTVGQTSLREGPDRRAASRGEALEGERARIVDRDGEWVHVRLGSSREGWVPRADVGEI